MSSTTALTGGISFLQGGMGIINSIGSNASNKAANRASTSLRIADVLYQGNSEATDMRIEAMKYDNEALNIRRAFSDEIRIFDEQSAADTASVKTSFASSGVALSGSALDVIAATEDSAARRRMARQNSADNEALERESMAAMLRLSATSAIARAKEETNFIKLNSWFKEQTINRSTVSDMGSTIAGMGTGLAKNLLKDAEDKKKEAAKAKQNYQNYIYGNRGGLIKI